MSSILAKAAWLEKLSKSGDLRPYVYVRGENKIQNPGSRHRLDWFPYEPVHKDPFNFDELEFAEMIYHLENAAFGGSNMPMPRWVFYDCAVMPGFVAGFAMRSSALSDSLKKVLRWKPGFEWTPISLFIIIPTMKKGEWVAHNLCAVNSLLDEKDRFYGLGFLSKAFGLWYANVETCCGITQWGSPALKLHTHFGHLQILTSYTPVHTHPNTITYRSKVDTSSWERFFTKEVDYEFLEQYEPSGLVLVPNDHGSMLDLQRCIEKGRGPYFLSATEISMKELSGPLTVFSPKKMKG